MILIYPTQRKTPEGLRFKEIAAKGDLVPDELVVNLLTKILKNGNSQVSGYLKN